jgi:hypothetical protein
LTDEERERGLRALAALERMNEEFLAQGGGVLLPSSGEILNKMRDERTRELMRAVDE